MKAKDYRYVLDTVEDDGFHYSFHHYSDFKEIEDEEFHRLKDAYIKASEELAEYSGVEV